MKPALRILVFLVLSVPVIGCRTGAPLHPDHPRQFPGVVMQDVTFYSSALQHTMPYRVYEPKSIPVGATLPLVLLLHGGGGDFRDWSNYSDAGQYAAKGMVLVMPEGKSSYYMNAALHPNERYEDYIVRDLMADVESRFPVVQDRAHYAIVGVSMGGFAAIKLALTRPDLFAFAGAISPAIDVPSRKFSWRRWQQSIRFRAIFGSNGSTSRRNSNPFVLIRSADPTRTPYLYVTAGDQEPLAVPIRRFIGELKARDFAYELHTGPGGHDWNEWNTQIPGCFTQLLAHLQK